MDEIEKIYKTCNIKKYRLLDRDHKLKWVYPSFTAEKQIELIKWLARNTYRNYFTVDYYFNEKYWRCKCNLCVSCGTNDFENALASVLNALWQSLTKEERKQIKDILE